MNDSFTRSDFLTTLTLLASASAVLVGAARVFMDRCDAARLKTLIGRAALLSIAAVVAAELTGGLLSLQQQISRWGAPRDVTQLRSSLLARDGQPRSLATKPSASLEAGPEQEEVGTMEGDEVTASSVAKEQSVSDASLLESIDDFGVRQAARAMEMATATAPTIVEAGSVMNAVREDSQAVEQVTINSHIDQVRWADAEVISTHIVRLDWMRESSWRWLLGMWLLGSLGLVLRAIVVRSLWAWRYRSAAISGDQTLHSRVAQLGTRLGYHRAVRLRMSSDWQGPVAWGVVCPTIGLPDDFCSQFDSAQQDAMLAHELGHLAARDPLWLLLADVVTATLWWAPWCWWLRANLKRAAETAADEATLVLADGPRILAECLVVLGQQITRPASFGYAATGSFRSSLGKRVKRLLELEQTDASRTSWRSPSQNQIAAIRVALVISVIVAMVGAAWARPGREHSLQTIQKEGRTMSWFDSTWRKSLLGSLVAMTLVTGHTPLSDTHVASAEESKESAEAKDDDSNDDEKAEEPDDDEEESATEVEVTAEVADDVEANEVDEAEELEEPKEDKEEEEEEAEEAKEAAEAAAEEAEEAVREDAEAREEAIREQVEREMEDKVAQIEESVERTAEQVAEEIERVAERMAEEAQVKADLALAQADQIAQEAAKRADEAVAKAKEFLAEKQGDELHAFEKEHIEKKRQEKLAKKQDKGREKAKELKERIKQKKLAMAWQDQHRKRASGEASQQALKAQRAVLEMEAQQLDKQRHELGQQMEMLANQQEHISDAIERVHERLKAMDEEHEHVMIEEHTVDASSKNEEVESLRQQIQSMHAEMQSLREMLKRK